MKKTETDLNIYNLQKPVIGYKGSFLPVLTLSINPGRQKTWLN